MLTRAKTRQKRKSKISSATPFHFWYRFLALILILTIGFSIVTVAGIGIGRAAPNPTHDFFTSPDGSMCEMPCLFGIRPGHTTIHEAIEMLHTHPLTNTLVPLPFMHLAPYYMRGLAYGGNGGQIIFITLYASPTLVNSSIFRANYASQDDFVFAIRIGSMVKTTQMPALPTISNELERAWRNARFTTINAVLGQEPENVNFEMVGSMQIDQYAHSVNTYTAYMQADYYGRSCLFTYFPPKYWVLDFMPDNNPLSSILILTKDDWNAKHENVYDTLRFILGDPARQQKKIKWQGYDQFVHDMRSMEQYNTN